MSEEKARMLIEGCRGYRKQVENFERAIENYSVSTHGEDDVFLAARTIVKFADMRDEYISRLRLVRDVLMRLLPRERKCLVWSYVHRRGASEISERLGVNASTFYRTRARALKKFADIADEHRG